MSNLFKHAGQLYFHNTALPQNNKCDFDENYFENNKVKYCNATLNVETGLKFDPPVYLQRYTAVQEILLNKNVREQIKTVVDFGCAELKFFKYLKNSINIQNVLLVDIDGVLLENYSNRIEPFNADYLCRRKTPLHVEILQGSIDYPELKLISVDAVICIEIIEHLYPDTLDALPHNIFYFMEPRVAIFTTPNSDFNVLFTNFSGIRHYDHKFEWSRQQFQDWAHNITLRYPKYSVYFVGVGPGPSGTENLGCCSQMAVFIKTETTDNVRLDLIRSYQEIVNESNRVIDFNHLKDCFPHLYDVVSYGVCTYQSYINSNFKPFELIRQVDYPYEIDNRSEEEIILHETEYRMYRLGNYSRIYSNEDNFRTEIPLYKLTINDGGEYISVQELRKILEKAGYQIEECEINDVKVPCVIYEDTYVQSDRSESQSHSRSHSPELNYSTDVNWDSESQWDLDSSAVGPSHFNMEMGIKKTESIILWDEANQQQQQQNNSDPPGENESPLSDPCVSGEQTEQNEQQNCSADEKVELLFDSGYQVSTSSIDLSPDFMKDWLQEEKSDYLGKSEGEHAKPSKSYQVNSSDSLKPRDLKSEGQMKINIKKANKNEDRAPPQVQQPPIPEQAPELQEIVENGDLANNNRDREGNNYQAAAAAENLILELDDNAVPRPENLDEHNENHIVLDEQINVPDVLLIQEHNENHIVLDEQINEPNVLVIEQIGDFQEDDDFNESLGDASREVQFDQNSELSFSDESLAIHGVPILFENYNIVLHSNVGRQTDSATLESEDTDLDSQDTFQTAAGFPIWLLQMLNMTTEDPLGLLPEDAHFFSQGDGLGIHPSTVNIDDEDSTSSSDRSGNSDGGIAIAANPSHPNSATATLGSDVDSHFYDALESGHVTHVFLDVNDVTLGERIVYPRTQSHFAQTDMELVETGEEVVPPVPENVAADDDHDEGDNSTR